MAGPLRIGILGASQIAPTAIVGPARRIAGAEVVAVAASRAGAAAAFADRHGIPTAYADYRALLDDPDVDLVYNSLGVRDHAPLTVAALQAGKHVLCEKPIAADADEARRIVAAAAATGRRAVEAFHYRHHPLFRALLDLRDRGVLGTVRELHSEISDVRPVVPGSVLSEPGLGGGALLHAGCYAVDWSRALVGEEPTVESAELRRNDLGADGAVRATLAFPGGARADLEVAMIEGSALRPGNRLTLVGERATVHVENLIAPHHGHSVSVRTSDGAERMFTVAGETSYLHQLDAVVAALAAGTPLPSEGDELVRGMSVIDAIRDAAAGV